MAGVINFVEQQRQVYIYDFIVYVAGVDISAYVKDLSITYTNKSSPGSADISLSNPFDQWILTNKNFTGSFRTSNDRYSESAKKQIVFNKINLSKQSVANKLQDTKGEVIKEVQQFGIKNTIAGSQDFLQRYTFGPGSCVFSRFDTVKIFIKCPIDPPEKDRWIPAFTGILENKPFTTNFINGDSTISLSAFDIRSTLQYMRMGVNPYSNSGFTTKGELYSKQRNQYVFIDEASAGFFEDYYPGLPQGNSEKSPRTDNIFAGKSFVDSISMITCGKTGWVNGGKPVTDGEGVGFFQPGKVYKYANPKNTNVKESGVVTDLADWDNLCIFGNTKKYLTERDCIKIGTRSWWGAQFDGAGQAYTPMHGYVHFLIPAEGLNISNLIRTSFEGANNIMGSPEWSTRLSLISNFCEMVDYEFTVSGSGDMIFEFPMYDFFPSNFGSNSSLYVLDKHAVSENIADEGGDVVSAVEVQTSSTTLGGSELDKAFTAAAPATAVAEEQRAIAFSNILVSKYGVRIANKTITGVQKASLPNFARLELQKRLAEANKMQVDFSFRPWLRPNRPLLHVERARIGKITSITLSMPPLQECKISATLGCVRTSLKKADGTVEFQHVFAGEGMALSYNSIFENPNGVSNNSGIATNADVPKKGK